MLRVGINGFGRIGKGIYRANLEKKVFQIVAINDVGPDDSNLAYQANYDTLYGRLKNKLHAKDGYLCNFETSIKVFHHRHIDEVPWQSVDVDIVIDASGVLDNVLRAQQAIGAQGLKKVIVTHSPDPVDFTMILGANEEQLDVEKHHVISSSICDATAMAPVLKAIHQHFDIERGYSTTLHPWLNYQNLMDGAASSWSVPGQIYHHYALGRSSIGNIIPKPTTAVDATCKVLDGVTPEMIGSFSYRTPHAIVGSADLTLITKKVTTKKEVIQLFEEIEQTQRWDIIHNNTEPLVSNDFKQEKYSAVIDHRWTDVIDGVMLKLVLWYDNEWGYSSRVVDQIEYIEERMK